MANKTKLNTHELTLQNKQNIKHQLSLAIATQCVA